MYPARAKRATSTLQAYEGCVVDSVIIGSSDVTTCSRSPSQPVVWNIPPGARRKRPVESRLVTNGRSVEIIYRLAVTDPFEI
jgi:hypothetical protein